MEHLGKYWIYHIAFWAFIFTLNFLSFFDAEMSAPRDLIFFMAGIAILFTMAAFSYVIFFGIRFYRSKIMKAVVILLSTAGYSLSVPHLIRLFMPISNSYIPRAITFIFIELLFFGMCAILDNIESQKRYGELQLVNQRNALALLTSQVNPHFLMNTLNNIYASFAVTSPEGAQMLLRLSELLRHSYRAIKLDKIPLGEEIAYLKNYIELEQARLSQRANINFNIQVNDELRLVPPMLLITFVENAFKHGLSEMTEDSFLTIDLALQGDSLFFVVKNSKPAGKQPGPEGTGLKNTRERLQLLYPGKHVIQIEDTIREYAVTLQLNL